MDDNGYLDRLYVHKDYQGKGIATLILNELEKHAILQGLSLIKTHASITAKPFLKKACLLCYQGKQSRSQWC